MRKNLDIIAAYSIMLGLIILVGFLQSWSMALSILCLCLISAVMTIGANIQWGYAGLINFGIMGYTALGGLAAVLVSAPPVEEAWRPGTAPRFLAEGIVWPQHIRPATAVAEGEPPDDWPQFCKAFCITIKEGTRAQHLRLLFETYAREQPGAISREEARDVCLKHVHRSGRVEERPAKNAVCAQELVEDFDSVSREGFLDCVGFEELWRRHMRVYKQLKIDVWCLLQDLGRRDAAERAVMRRPFEQKRRDAWSLIDRKMATDVANFKDTL